MDDSLHVAHCARRRREETDRQTEREGRREGEGRGAGLSFLGDQTASPGCPLKTEILHKLFVFSD